MKPRQAPMVFSVLVHGARSMSRKAPTKLGLLAYQHVFARSYKEAVSKGRALGLEVLDRIEPLPADVMLKTHLDITVQPVKPRLFHIAK